MANNIDEVEDAPQQPANNNTFRTVIFWVLVVAVAVVLWRVISNPIHHSQAQAFSELPVQITDPANVTDKQMGIFQQEVFIASGYNTQHSPLDCNSRFTLALLLDSAHLADLDLQKEYGKTKIARASQNLDYTQGMAFQNWISGFIDKDVSANSDLRPARVALQKAASLKCVSGP